MKLATLHDGSRDGQLVVVSRDLETAHFATGIAGRLQQLLDDWNFVSPQLEDLYATLNGGKARHAFPFDPQACMAPLPRAADVLWMRAWPGLPGDVAPPPSIRLSGAALHGPAEVLPVSEAACALPALAVLAGPLAAGADAGAARDAVRLLGLAVLWDEAADEAMAGEIEPHHRFPATSFAPVVVTPDEVGPGGFDGRLAGTVTHGLGRSAQAVELSGMDSGLGELLSARVRRVPLRPGSLLLAGPLGGLRLPRAVLGPLALQGPDRLGAWASWTPPAR